MLFPNCISGYLLLSKLSYFYRMTWQFDPSIEAVLCIIIHPQLYHCTEGDVPLLTDKKLANLAR